MVGNSFNATLVYQLLRLQADGQIIVTVLNIYMIQI